MRYHKGFKAYCADIKIKEGQHFKFYVDGTWRVSKEYPIEEVT